MITQEQKNEILKLHGMGLSSSQIGRKFDLDHTTVLYHIKNPDKLIRYRKSRGRIKKIKVLGPRTDKPIKAKIIIKDGKKSYKYKKDIHKIILTGKSYADYLDNAMRVYIVRDKKGKVIEKRQITIPEFKRLYGYKLHKYSE